MYHLVLQPLYHLALQLGTQLQASIGEYCVQALPAFAAVLAVYFFIVFRRGRSRP